MKRKFLAPIATIISALATETGIGKPISDIGEARIEKNESDFFVATHHRQVTPFVLEKPANPLFFAAHASHSSHASHYSGIGGGSGPAYSPSNGSPSQNSTTQGSPGNPVPASSIPSKTTNPTNAPTNATAGRQADGLQERIAKCRSEEYDFHRKVLITDYAVAGQMWEKLKSCMENTK